MTTLFHASVGKIVATPYGHELNLQTYAECCEVAQRCGFPIAEGVRAKASGQLTMLGSGSLFGHRFCDYYGNNTS